MKAAIYNRLPHSVDICNRMQAGLEAHGHEVEQRRWADYTATDLAITWGHRGTHIYDGQRSAGADYLVMERGYVGDRMHWTSLGFNGLNGYAERPEPGNWDRGERFHDQLRGLHGGGYALVMGQVPGDASIVGLNLEEWICGAMDQAEKLGFEARFRPHPLGSPSVPFKRHTGPLLDELAGAGLVLTYNSNSGCDAVLAGCPVIADSPGSMVFDLAQRNDYYTENDRLAWLNRVAWAQWTPTEISSGAAWEHLSQGYQ